MRDVASVVAELREMYESGRSHGSTDYSRGRPDQVVSDEVESWSRKLRLSRAEIYDHVALYLARNFQNSELSFEFCDAVLNDLFSAITFFNETRPALFWKVYLAFDEGEYRHPNDNVEVDPVERYTRPMLKEILSEAADIQIR